MKRLYLSIFLCLCTLYSVKAAPKDSLRLKALEYERAYFTLESPQEAERSLLLKAQCLLQLSDTAAAEACLKRISMYLLDTQDQREVEEILQSLHPAENQTEKKKHSGVWAFLPPIGHIMAGKSVRGILMAAADMAALTFGVWQAVSGNWITAYIIGAGTLSDTYYNEAVRLLPYLTE